MQQKKSRMVRRPTMAMAIISTTSSLPQYLSLLLRLVILTAQSRSIVREILSELVVDLVKDPEKEDL